MTVKTLTFETTSDKGKKSNFVNTGERAIKINGLEKRILVFREILYIF